MAVPLKHCSLLLLCLTNALHLTQQQPVNKAAAATPVTGAGNGDFVSHKDEIVLVEDVVRYTDNGTNATAALITLSQPMMLLSAKNSVNANAKQQQQQQQQQQVDALEQVEQLVHHQDNVDDNESILDTSAGASDDLIFLAVKKPAQQQQQQQQKQKQPEQQRKQQQQSQAHHSHAHSRPTQEHREIDEIDLLTVDDLFASSSSCSSGASCESPNVPNGTNENNAVPHEIVKHLHAVAADANDDDDDDVDDDGNDDALSASSSSSSSLSLATSSPTAVGPSRPSIDMRDFVALIPADEVKSIVANYYRNDAEVQRAYAYLSGREFLVLKQRIIDIPEMSAFLSYLNASGLDLLGFFYTLTNLTASKAPPAEEKTVAQQTSVSLELPLLNRSSSSVGSDDGNDILKNSISAPALLATTTTPTTTPATTPPPATTSTAITIPKTTTTSKITAASSASITTAAEPELSSSSSSSSSPSTTTAAAAAAVESLNGLHGLVDSILDVLPQDQILSTFFDKLESNEQFSKLVDNIGSPEFAKILQNMENSVPLRNLIYTLHNNGIFVTRIVDSLKAYFFLGTF